MMILILSFWTAAATVQERCNWGFVGPIVYQCEGKTYHHGSARDSKANYPSLFCEASKSNDCAACASDKAPQTLACQARMEKERR